MQIEPQRKRLPEGYSLTTWIDGTGKYWLVVKDDVGPITKNKNPKKAVDFALRKIAEGNTPLPSTPQPTAGEVNEEKWRELKLRRVELSAARLLAALKALQEICQDVIPNHIATNPRGMFGAIEDEALAAIKEAEGEPKHEK